MFKVSSLAYVKALSGVVAPPQDKMFVGAVAVASSIVEQLPLPSVEVESPTAHYSKNLAMSAREQISVFNELCPIDTKACIDVCRKLWLFRYNVLYGNGVYVGVEGDFFCGYMQCGLQFSPNEMELMNKYAVPISLLQNHIRLMIDQEAAKLRAPIGGVVRVDGDTSIVERMPASY